MDTITHTLFGLSLYGAVDKRQMIVTLTSAEEADLEPLFTANPAAKTLVEWSPFVVIVDEEDHLGVYDPRFYRSGESFLYEYFERLD